ncbi:glycosyltransferase family 4 protein [Gaiella sp.]|jgi:glycosyltransferase involved in cell wall biosynthesis|uniref:glycosyltransferase family 4 protein n=1 Tax=Gaiella sp. TaxID=2663207 RepID=UPI002E37BA1D|nr:glycosyltransferase family 4 protein [Gaiella sp.]HEX5582107.1 glycosyltransferase family 4 protein [Gaiella sp.]
MRGRAEGSPIRVLRVIARLNMGGPALHVTYLARGLAERGYETTLVAGDVGRGEQSMAFVAERAGVEVVRLPGLSREVSPVRDAVAAWRVARIIRRVRPDVVHTHTAKAGAIGRAAALLAGPGRRPVVVHTFHGHVLRGYFGTMGTLLFRAIETALARVTDRLIAVSPEVRDELVGLRVAPREKFSVVRLGIELEPRVRFEGDATEVRRRHGIPADKFVVGWFGRMTAVKRTDDLLTMLAGVRERGIDALLLLVGDGDDRVRLEQRAHDLGLARSCLFAGYQEDVAPWYAICDVVVLTSASEGTPVTIIEALAAARPVVATRVGGVPDVVDEGETGFLVRPRDTHALAERLEILARDPERRFAMGEAGRQRMLERYAVDRLVSDVDALYRELLTPVPTTSATRRR